MPRVFTLCLAVAVSLGGLPAFAQSAPDFLPSYPIEHEQDARLQSETPPRYAMQYTDEAAQNMGVVNGRADFFNSGRPANPFVPAVTAGVDRGGPMFRLQWHPGG